ncbi:hypothetical protein [Actinomadura flavalba]|uniref:WXG100-like domain-containing protein n=1 Tax=Actinomadura flavalba TaxID=1120938 RepID=UPI000362F0F5|nr:hypothetical protein [Actinomadura flavalba]
MGLQLPGELTGLLGMLGYSWPEADETKLFQLGTVWTEFGSTLRGTVQAADTAAQRVWTQNKGEDFAAFQERWTGEESPSDSLGTAAMSCLAAGCGLFLAAGVVLALKINVIVQLVMLAIQIAQAIAAAIPTFGASLTLIPLMKIATGLLIDIVIDQAIGALLGG